MKSSIFGCVKLPRLKHRKWAGVDLGSSKILILFIFSLLHAEEGMWPLNMVPQKEIQAKYGVTLSEEWLLQVQKACLRISLGGSGAFVSSQGLILTNHHVGSEAIYNLSIKENNLIEKGFYAPSPEQELKCPNMYVDQLISIADITEEVELEMQGLTSGADKERVQQEVVSRLKTEYQARTSLQPQLITLYGGAKYQLYLYKRYTDIRLVFAPEKAIAFFGGDQDNFEYPRYNLDICFFRAYENDKPVVTDDYLPWSTSGPKPSELLVVGGNPGHTARLYTTAHLAFFKNEELPFILRLVSKKLKVVEEFAKKSGENGRIASEQISRLQNTSKAFNGISQGLKNNVIIHQKKAFEAALEKKQNIAPALQNLEQALKEAKPIYPSYMILEGMGSNYCTLYRWAKQFVRLSEELQKPDNERLKEYTDTELPTLKLALLSSQPIYPSLEKVNFTCGLKFLKKIIGSRFPFKKESPDEIGRRLIENTRLADLEYRKELWNHPEKVKTSPDPLIQLALALDPLARELRKKIEDNLESVKKESYAQITAALFRQFGETIYPDATFSLRLSMGTLRGYQEKRVLLPPMTTLAETFQHAKAHHSEGPFQLPPSWEQRKESLEKNQTGFNFVSTHDIVGGNSGSPMINLNKELVGLIFDGNIYSLIWDYQYNDEQGRAISVHSHAILEALEKIYQATPLVTELKNANSL